VRRRLCRSSATSIASGTVSHNRVEPSISVSKNVTVPVGSSASSGPVGEAADAPVLAAAPAELSLNATTGGYLLQFIDDEVVVAFGG
jgi:hypothetical protein